VQLAAANQELEAFSYSVSHDLRAPLRSIDGFSQALLEDFGDQIPAEGRSYLDRTRAAAQRMAALIDDLLALSRVSRASVDRSAVDLSGMAAGIAAELQREQPKRQVEFVITPGMSVQGDENLLRIALQNLLANAWKFTSKQPSARIEFGVEPSDKEAIFFVRDNGSGFDMTYVDKLFGAFQRLHSNDQFPGTGIGLATVQRIFRKHGGRAWAQGAVGQGATFFFTL
jgi:light-regulated signal transduction histidine kinase (bacteriophytochrome)